MFKDNRMKFWFLVIENWWISSKLQFSFKFCLGLLVIFLRLKNAVKAVYVLCSLYFLDLSFCEGIYLE